MYEGSHEELAVKPVHDAAVARDQITKVLKINRKYRYIKCYKISTYPISQTNLKRFGDRASWAYTPNLWNELPDNIKAADRVQNFETLLKGVYLTILTIKHPSTDYSL